jgi:hypothetical protein
MAFGPGFNYIQGKYELRWSVASSSQTIQKGNLVTLDARRFVALADSDSTAIYGVADADSADSLSNALSGRLPIIVPYPDTVFAAPIQGAGGFRHVHWAELQHRGLPGERQSPSQSRY